MRCSQMDKFIYGRFSHENPNVKDKKIKIRKLKAVHSIINT